MKESDLNEVKAKVEEMYDSGLYHASEVMPREPLCNAITSIYMNADSNKGNAYDMTNGYSVIASERNISVIYEGNSSHYRCRQPLILYDDLVEDLESLFITIDAVLYRMEYNAE